MWVLVCGGRNFLGTEEVWDVLNAIDGISVIVSGEASGADSAALEWARRKYIPRLACPANWKQEGRAAGPIRNRRMIEIRKPDLVIAFPGGTGTANMVRLAKKHGIEVREIPNNGG